MPGGCMLIKTSVFDKLEFPWYFECYQWPGANGMEAWKNMMRHSFSCFADEEALKSVEGTKFEKWINEVHKIESVNNWQFYSEDLNFCRKCIKAGITIWCDMDITFEMIHLGVQEVTCSRPVKESVICPAVM
jgi:hypothetical protein